MTRRHFIGTSALLVAAAAPPTTRIALGNHRNTAVALRTLDGDSVAVSDHAITALARRLSGDVLTDDVRGYHEARHIWNAAIDRRPALIVRCADARDVTHAVRFAEQYNALVSVRGGGHNAAGFAICDGGLVIDLTRIRTVTVDPARRTARVGGGATFAEYDAATGHHGLASTGPIISMVGVGGYTLGGGVGWLHRKLGLACDNLIAAQVITADGRIIEASSAHHPDLFWAIRGGGGNFGVVTAFEFRVAPVSTVLAGFIYHPLEDLPEVAAIVRDFNAIAPDEACVWLTARKAPASRSLPVEMHGRPVAVIAICYASSSDDGDRVLRPLRRFGQPLLDQVRVRSYVEWQRSLDGAWEDGFQNHWVGHYLPELTDASARTMLEHVSNVSSPHTDVKLVTLGGAVARVNEDDTAFSHRQSKYALVIQTRWASSDESTKHLAWSDAFFEAMRAHSTGKVYVNFMADEGAGRVRDAYNPRTLGRLRAIKMEYDHSNRFRMNQNIRPG